MMDGIISKGVYKILIEDKVITIPELDRGRALRVRELCSSFVSYSNAYKEETQDSKYIRIVNFQTSIIMAASGIEIEKIKDLPLLVLQKLSEFIMTRAQEILEADPNVIVQYQGNKGQDVEITLGRKARESNLLKRKIDI